MVLHAKPNSLLSCPILAPHSYSHTASVQSLRPPPPRFDIHYLFFLNSQPTTNVQYGLNLPDRSRLPSPFQSPLLFRPSCQESLNLILLLIVGLHVAYLRLRFRPLLPMYIDPLRLHYSFLLLTRVEKRKLLC